MNAEFPTLAAVLQEHPIQDGGNYCGGCGWRAWTREGASNGCWEEHVEQVWREACTVRTAEQLDALPMGSVVRTDEGRVAEKTGERWGNQSGHGSWWSVADEDEFDVSSGELDDLPALLLRHPDWAQS